MGQKNPNFHSVYLRYETKKCDNFLFISVELLDEFELAFFR